jgi:hypothetical protein
MSDLVEIFVTEIAEEVTLNVTPNLIEVNVIKGVAPTNPITGTGTTNFLPKFTGGSTLGNSLIFDNGTNVGIGTSSPSTALHVIGAGTFSSIVTAASAILKNNSSNATYLTLDGTNRTSGRNYEIGTGYSPVGNEKFYIYDNTANVSRLVIGSSGNVGIGTTSPTSKLHVTGLPSFADNAAALSGGLTVGAFYHTSGTLKVVI